MKRLFSKKDTLWKQAANDLSQEVGQSLRVIIDKWTAKGYSLREITHVIVMEATSLSCEYALTKRFEMEKKKREKTGEAK